MTKKELIDAMVGNLRRSQVGSINKAQAEAVVDALFEVIGDELADDGRVTCAGFGTFKVMERAARKGRNPQTGAEIDIAASKTVTFKPTPALKAKVDA